jgi:hypothetical protein
VSVRTWPFKSVAIRAGQRSGDRRLPVRGAGRRALFELVVITGWPRQVIVALELICRGSCRGVIEFMRDLLGVPMSVGTVHQVLESAARKADVINHEQVSLSRFVI